MSSFYYKIVPIHDTKSIVQNGLNSDEGEIFVSDYIGQLPLIAQGQIGLLEYSIIKIDSQGITGEILPDNVAEIGSGHQFIVKQKNIPAAYIEHVEDVKWIKWDLNEHCERLKAQVMGMDEANTNGLIEQIVRCTPEWCEYYNKKYGKNLEPIELPK